MSPAPVRLLDAGAVSPLRSQALYHGLADRMDDAAPDTVVLCRPAAPCFCVGHHQSPREELDLDWCREQGYPVIRRRIGGGTVFLDGRQLFYQCVFHRRRAPFAVEAIYRRALMPVVRALEGLGLRAALEAVNEIEVDGRRIAGTGGGQIGEAVVVVGNLLLDFPVETMGRAWRVPSAQFRRLAEDGLRRHLVTLGRALGEPPSHAELGRRLAGEYERALGRPLVPGSLTPAEEAAVRREEARLGRLAGAPAEDRRRRSSLKITRRVRVHEWIWPGLAGPARVSARVADGRIEELVVAGGGMDGDEAERRVREALVTAALR
jgi:lipoate-protein ligase A